LGKVDVPVRWVSFEPLSWNVAPLVATRIDNFNWAVIGAASDDRGKYHAPSPVHVEDLEVALRRRDIPVFYKGNMKSLTDQYEFEWRAEFPHVEMWSLGRQQP
jgi:protein gp37